MSNLEDAFGKLNEKVNPELAAKVGTCFAFEIENGDVWLADLRGAAPWFRKATDGEAEQAACTFLLASEQDAVDLITGRLDGLGAFFSGKLKIKGSQLAAMKLAPLLEAR
jgi:putative sterol carrier protein